MNIITHKNKKGFTLIEVLIAITVFAIGILAVAKMQITAMNGNSFARYMTDASNIAQDEMEKLLALDYNNVLLNDTNGDGTNKDTDPRDGIDDTGNDFGLNNDTIDSADHYSQYQGAVTLYNIFWNIAVDEPTTGNKHIRVIVSCAGKKSPKEIRLDAVKADI